MINIMEVSETNKMVEHENLDVRTITIGISLLDCIDSDLKKLNDNIYKKITTVAKDLVSAGNQIEQEFGIPIVNKRISVTPIALIGGAACKTPEDFATIADTMDAAAKAIVDRARLKTSVTRLVNILFPELEKLVPTLHMNSVYALLSEFPGAKQIASCHLTRLVHLLSGSSKGHYNRNKAIEIREAARSSIGSAMPAKSLELKHTIHLIEVLSEEIDEIETLIREIMDENPSPILSIPGISYRMGAMILAEIGDFTRFSSPDQILAYAGLSPSTYQSGKLANAYPHMEKRGSRYLRYALFNATKFVCNWDPTFAAYLAKKRAEGKHYNVAISHAAKKLVRVICAIQKSGKPYCPAT